MANLIISLLSYFVWLNTGGSPGCLDRALAILIGLAGMTGRGKARKPAGGKKHTKSARAGLVMPVGRVHRYLKLGRYAPRTSAAASVYLSAVIEYLVAEVNELSGNAAKANKR